MTILYDMMTLIYLRIWKIYRNEQISRVIECDIIFQKLLHGIEML